MSGPFGSQQWMYASGGFYPHEIETSVRLDNGGLGHFFRTPASAGNRKTFTWSGWFKRGDIANYGILFAAGNTNDPWNATAVFHIGYLASADRISIYNNGTYLRTLSAKLRDTSSWYHLVVAVDTTNSTAGDRVKVYLNGVEQTSFSLSNNPSLNLDTLVNATHLHVLGGQPTNTAAAFFDGYLAEVNFIDGSALTASSFGEFKEGIWVAKDTSTLTFGTNGFYLPFKQTTSANGFNTVRYVGNGSTQSIEGVGFEPDLVWLKDRSSTQPHLFYDSIRGAGANKEIVSNSSAAEGATSGGFYGDVTSFNADGFTVAAGSSNAAYVNNNFDRYVAWCWGGGTNDKTYTVTVVDDSGNKYRFDGHGTSSITLELTEGATYTFNYPSAHPLRFSTTSDGTHGGGSEYTTGVTHVSDTQTTFTVPSGAPVLYYYCSQHSGMGGQINTNTTDGPTHAEGTILSRAKPNADYGFSIVSYTGDNTNNNARIAHGLSSAPEMIIAKRRDSTSNWWVYHKDLNGGTDPYHYYLLLNSDAAEGSRASKTNKVWGTSNPDADTFGAGIFGPNGTGTKIAYCFHSVDGYSKLGAYSGTGSSGNAITGLGFEPAFIMIKNATTAGYWWMIKDNTRDATNPNNLELYANVTDTEYTASGYDLDFDSDGFTIDATAAAINGSGDTYIYLAIADTRDAAFWTDASGNGNDFNQNYINHKDLLPDTPTNNFSTYHPEATTSGFVNEAYGNLRVTSSGNHHSPIGNTMYMSSGKWYWEIYVQAVGTLQIHGIVPDVRGNGYTTFHADIYPGSYADEIGYRNTGAIYRANGGTPVATYSTYTTGDILGFALDMDNGTLDIYKNNSSAGAQFTGLSGTYRAVSSPWSTSSTCTINFGQDSSFNGFKIPQGNKDSNQQGDFYYTPPSGYLALCNSNLPNPAIDPNAGDNPAKHFNIALYTGNGGTQSITGVGFQPDWTWIKSRSAAYDHVLIDSVRGVEKQLISNKADAETQDSGNGLISFDTDGFTVKLGTSTSYNNSSQTYAAWNWKANGAGESNTDGSITSTVSVNENAGFSIATYTGTGASATVGHGLSKAPNVTIIKPRNFSDNWIFTHDMQDGSDDQLYLNLATANSSPSASFTVTQNASTIGLTSWNNVNDTGDTYVMYCFTEKDGFSKFGKYNGNGSTNGSFIYTGFRPAYILIKQNSTGNWTVYDAGRDPHNAVQRILYAGLNATENTGTDRVDFLSNGFKWRDSSNDNTSGFTHYYMAFAEQPFKYANAR